MFAKWKSKLKAAIKEAKDKRNGRNGKHPGSEALAEPVVTIEKQSDGLSRPCEYCLHIAPIAIACWLTSSIDPAEGTQVAGLVLTADACCCSAAAALCRRPWGQEVSGSACSSTRCGSFVLTSHCFGHRHGHRHAVVRQH
jgi:hypothetical protein